MKRDVDTIEEVKKSPHEARTFEEVLKFNPFHGWHGYFTSAANMRTYSANPKTKAGAMAIERSHAAGYGSTMNVHAESKGENIGQNANWIKTGQKPSHIKPTGVKHKPKKKQGQKTQANGELNSKGEPINQVHGKDISKTFKCKEGQEHPSGNEIRPLTQVAEAQGFNGPPTVVSQKQFDAAVKKSGMIGYRTIDNGTDYITGKQKTGEEFAKELMYGPADTFSHNGIGGMVLGGGLYVATTDRTPGKVPSRQKAKEALEDSQCYGWSLNARTVQITLSPSAKIGDYESVREDFFNAPLKERQATGNELGAYAAAKGYDALTKHYEGDCNYTVVLNRTAIIMSNEFMPED